MRREREITPRGGRFGAQPGTAALKQILETESGKVLSVNGLE